MEANNEIVFDEVVRDEVPEVLTDGRERCEGGGIVFMGEDGDDPFWD